MTAHVSATPVNVRSLRSEVPLELERLVAAMLRKRPEERPQQPGEVAKKLIEFARGCELKELVQRAETPTLSPASKIETDSKLQELDKPKTQSFLHRPVRLYKAIAAGFFGMVVGLCLGIIITITNPDGSKTTITIPDGSKVEFAESGKPTNTQSGQTAPNESSLSGSPQRAIAPPLQFALLVNRESSGKAPYISDKELANMIEQLPRTNSNAVVQNDFAKFVRVAEDPGSEFPISAWNNGYQYALISTDPKFSIGGIVVGSTAKYVTRITEVLHGWLSVQDRLDAATQDVEQLRADYAKTGATNRTAAYLLQRLVPADTVRPARAA